MRRLENGSEEGGSLDRLMSGPRAVVLAAVMAVLSGCNRVEPVFGRGFKETLAALATADSCQKKDDSKFQCKVGDGGTLSVVSDGRSLTIDHSTGATEQAFTFQVVSGANGRVRKVLAGGAAGEVECTATGGGETMECVVNGGGTSEVAETFRRGQVRVLVGEVARLSSADPDEVLRLR